MLLLYAAAVLAVLAGPATASAKPRHLEQVRTALVVRAMRCASCHVSNDAADWTDGGLNPYGARLREIAEGDSLAERIARLDRGPAPDDGDADRTRREKDRDIDGDGVPNWVEIIAGASPADPASVPSAKRIERVERVVGCTICHSETRIPGKQGLDANPHNAFGKVLARTLDTPDAKHLPNAELRSQAERLPILKRIALSRKTRPPHSKVTYWEKLRLMRAPADPDDNPDPAHVKRLRKRGAAQRSMRKRDPTRGLDVDAHPMDGFLEDIQPLD